MSVKARNGGVGEVDPSPRIVPMRVIVCSLMRTGTLSMRAALRELGLHDIYHMHTLKIRQDDLKIWSQFIKQKYEQNKPITRAQWDILLGDCQGAVDIPCTFFAQDLAEAYPEAQIVILNRDPERWYESCLNSIHSAVGSISAFDKALIIALDPELRGFGMFMHTMDKTCIGFTWPEKEKALSFFNRTYSSFRDSVSNKTRILEFSMKDGWGPLCKHLDLPVPTEVVDGKVVPRAFPRLNDGKSFGKAAEIRVNAMRKRVFWRVARFSQVALIGCGVWWYVRQFGISFSNGIKLWA